MASTDDISEKIADVLFEYLLRSANLVTGATPPAVGMVRSIGGQTASGVRNLAKKLTEYVAHEHTLSKSGEVNLADLDRAIKRMKQHARTIKVADADVKDFEMMLGKEQVLYAKIEAKADNYCMFMYMDKDEEKVENIVSALDKCSGIVTEIPSNLFIDSLHPDRITTIQHLDAAELALFRHYALQTGVLFTTVRQDDGYMLLVPSEDRDKAYSALFYAGWDLTGRNGAKVREQVKYHLEGRSALHIAAEEGSRELYIVSRMNPGDRIYISAEDYRLYKDGVHISTVSRASMSRDAFHQRLLKDHLQLREAVLMTPEEYLALTPESLAQMPTMDLLPAEYDEVIEMNTQHELRNLIAEKMALDDEGNTPIDVSDSSISYSEFSVYEAISDQEEREARERELEHYKATGAYLKRRFSFQEIERKENNLDYIITQAETKHREALRAEIRKDRPEPSQEASKQP